MKTKLIVTSLLVLGAATQAKAADVAVRRYVAPLVLRPMESFSWAGPYLGAQASYQWLKHDVLIGASNFPGLSVTENGAGAGLMAGFNSNPLNGAVFGVETDLLWNKLNGHYSVASSPIGSGATDFKNLEGNFDEKWSGATRIRLGFAKDKILPFISGGIAYSNIVTSGVVLTPATGTANFIIANYSENLVGWTAGAGADYAIANNMLMRLEYRYNDFGKRTLAYIPITMNYYYREKHNSNDIRVGVAYKF